MNRNLLYTEYLSRRYCCLNHRRYLSCTRVCDKDHDLPPPEPIGFDMPRRFWPMHMCSCISVVRTTFSRRPLMLNLSFNFRYAGKLGVIRQVLTLLPGPVFNRAYFSNMVSECPERKKKRRTES